jgi:hypothetical protein
MEFKRNNFLFIGIRKEKLFLAITLPGADKPFVISPFSNLNCECTSFTLCSRINQTFLATVVCRVRQERRR